MKTKERTVASAVAWDKLFLLKELSDPENWDGVDLKWVVQKINDPYTVYYSDAPRVAIMEYLVAKNFVIRTPFKVVLKVKAKDGRAYMYSLVVNELCSGSENLEDLIRELVNQKTSSLVSCARRDVKAVEVASVSAYVVEEV